MLWREVSTTGGVRLSRFYGARARRLLPASAAVGVVTMIGSATLLSPLEVRSVINDGIASALYFSNYRFAAQGIDYFAADRAPSPFQHYWSLGVEEQFYLVWPPMIIAAAWLTRRARRRTGQAATSTTPYLVVLALVAAVSFTASVITTHVAAPVAFFSLPTRAWQLAAGGLIALTATQWRRLPAIAAAITGWAGLAVILVACTRLGTTTPYPGTAALLPALGAALVIGAGCAMPTKGCGRFLALPPMRAIGRVSYSWYLWHWPVLVLAPVWLGHPLGLAERLVAAAVSAGLAVLTLRLIENPRPIRRSAAPLGPRQPDGRRAGHRSSSLRGHRGAGLGSRSGRAQPGHPNTDHHRRPTSGRGNHGPVQRDSATRFRPSADRGRGIRRPRLRPLQPRSAPCQR
jgi:peptidoglycan/LPS O-acetylase OafA/YrhL